MFLPGKGMPRTESPTTTWKRRPLALDEEIILASERRGSPLTVGVLAETDATVHIARLRHSLYRALYNHPIARARIAGGFGAPTAWDFPAESSVPPDLIREIQAVSQSDASLDPPTWAGPAAPPRQHPGFGSAHAEPVIHYGPLTGARVADVSRAARLAPVDCSSASPTGRRLPQMFWPALLGCWTVALAHLFSRSDISVDRTGRNQLSMRR